MNVLKERFQIQSAQSLEPFTEPFGSAEHHVQGPPEYVMTPEGPKETLLKSVDESLRSMVQAASTLALLCNIRSRALLNLHYHSNIVWGYNTERIENLKNALRSLRTR